MHLVPITTSKKMRGTSYKQMLTVLIKFFNIAVNDFGAN